MQKNLVIKLAIITGILLMFLYGIFGIPSSLSGDGLKQAVLKRIHLGLDLEGGTHMILQVQVEEAVAGETDRAIDTIKEELNKAKITFAEISRDPNRPDQFVIKGLSTDSTSAVRTS